MSKIYRYQGYPIVTPVDILIDEPAFTSTNTNMKELRSTSGLNSRWRLTFNIMYDAWVSESSDINVGSFFVDSVTKRNTTSTMEMVQHTFIDRHNPFKTGGFNSNASTSTMTINVPGQVDSGSTSATISITLADGSIPSDNLGNSAILAGTFVQFSNHNKLYLVTENVVHSNSTVTLNFFPGLKETVPASSTINSPWSTTKPTLHFIRSWEIDQVYNIRTPVL